MMKMSFIRASQKLEEIFAESHLCKELWVLIHDFHEWFLFSNLVKLFYIMEKIATGPKLTKLLTVEISTYFFPECWLMSNKLIDSVGEEAGLPIPAKPLLRIAFTKLKFSFALGIGTHGRFNKC